MAATFEKIPTEAVTGITTPADKLPVVELRPFTSKEWRQSKSLPEFYDTRACTLFHRGKNEPSATDLEDLVGPNNSETPRAWGERLPKKASLAAPRPNTDGKNLDIDKPQAFATTFDREKSTLDDIKNGGNGKVIFSCLRRAMSELDLTKQQNMKIEGRKMEDLPPKLSMMYAAPWEYYRYNKAYSLPEGSVTHSLPTQGTIDSLYLRLESLQYAYMDENIYDTFDRSNTLPSIHVGNAPMKRKNTKNDRGMRQSSGKVNHKPAYRLGVANSLDVLSHYGRPIGVEQHLSTQLKSTLSQIKKTKDLCSVAYPANIPAPRSGGTINPPRYDNSPNVAEMYSCYGPDNYYNMPSPKRVPTRASQTQSSTRLNLEGVALGTSGIKNHSMDTETHHAKHNENGLAKYGGSNMSMKSQAGEQIKGPNSIYSALNSSLPVGASARSLALQRAETLPAIVPGSAVQGYRSIYSSHHELSPTSAPDAQQSTSAVAPNTRESIISPDKMPRINEKESNVSQMPMSSGRSSVSAADMMNSSMPEYSSQKGAINAPANSIISEKTHANISCDTEVMSSRSEQANSQPNGSIISQDNLEKDNKQEDILSISKSDESLRDNDHTVDGSQQVIGTSSAEHPSSHNYTAGVMGPVTHVNIIDKKSQTSSMTINEAATFPPVAESKNTVDISDVKPTMIEHTGAGEVEGTADSDDRSLKVDKLESGASSLRNMDIKDEEILLKTGFSNPSYSNSNSMSEKPVLAQDTGESGQIENTKSKSRDTRIDGTDSVQTEGEMPSLDDAIGDAGPGDIDDEKTLADGPFFTGQTDQNTSSDSVKHTTNDKDSIGIVPERKPLSPLQEDSDMNEPHIAGNVEVEIGINILGSDEVFGDKEKKRLSSAVTTSTMSVSRGNSATSRGGLKSGKATVPTWNIYSESEAEH